jgi:LuxR family maltose regulon positive regulatory protein
VGSRSAEPASSPLRHKFVAPGIPRGSIARPRLDRQLSELFDTYSVVEIVAAPGSGKTVQAQLYAASCGRAVAWLTMDRSDRSASGLVFDLATALGSLAGDAAAAMHRTLQTNGTVEEAAAILASATAAHECLFVIDECQHIAMSADAASALDTFLEYVPEQTRVLLLAREELPWPLQKRYVHGQIAQIADSALNLTFEETVEYIEKTGAPVESCERIFASTGGWTAGVAFASRFGVGELPNLRDLSAYFGKQVLEELPEDEQTFLLETSVTDAVTREAAVALCGPDAPRLWSAVSSRHLPATSMTSNAIICHSLFRSFLQNRLLETRPMRRTELLDAYARYLASTRQFEEATEVWLSVGNLDNAQQTAIQALPALFTRTDWPVVARWLEAFGEERVYSDPLLIGASVRAVFGIREFERARAVIRKLDREGRLRAAIEQDPSLLATTAWAMQKRPQEALALLDKYDGDARADVVRYMIEVTIATRPITPPDSQDLADVERQMSWGLFLQGRLGELARLTPADDGSPVVNPNVVLTAAFREHSEDAQKLWLRVPQEIRERAHSRFIEAMIDLSRGDHTEARAHLKLALNESHRSGFSLLPVYEIFMGYLLLSDGHINEAIDVLEPVLDDMSRTGQRAYVEMAQCFLGLAYLRADRDSEAQLILREATASMSRCQRRLLLSMAAAGLSEAEARLGNDPAAQEAAAFAHHVAILTGNLALLVQAVRMFPDIQRREANRNLDDSRWRRLVIAPSARPKAVGVRAPESGTVVTLQPFGRDRDLYLDGKPANIGRTKILELVACLALHPNGIDRFELQQRLFPEADQRSGGNHFRQIAHMLRHGTGVALERRGNLVLFPTGVSIIANDIESERLLFTASAATGPERKNRLLAGLDLVRGAYLEGSILPWVEERRNYLNLVHEEARLELATLYLELGEAEQAREVCLAVIEANRYSDPAYRVLVQIERTVGSESSALAVYRRATEAMAELGLQPGDARRIFRRGVNDLHQTPTSR